MEFCLFGVSKTYCWLHRSLRCDSLLSSPLPWDKDHSYFQSRTADRKPWVMLMIQKPHQTSDTGHCTAWWGRAPDICPGIFFCFPDTAGASTLASLSLRPRNMKGTWKANATRLQQLQPSECINDQQVSQKVKLPTGLRGDAETMKQVEDFWNRGSFSSTFSSDLIQMKS